MSVSVRKYFSWQKGMHSPMLAPSAAWDCPFDLGWTLTKVKFDPWLQYGGEYWDEPV